MAESEICTIRFSKFKIPIIGILFEYLDTSIVYLKKKTLLDRGDANGGLNLKAIYTSIVCLIVGLLCNVKFEVVTFDQAQLAKDLHIMLMSKEDILYVDDIDISKVKLCFEASDCLVIVMSCLLILNTANVTSPLSEYLYLPWLGAVVRGLLTRQAPTAAALLYTSVVISDKVNPLFLTTYSFLFLLEARFCLEVARVIFFRWERRVTTDAEQRGSGYEVETLFSSEDEQSIEVRNFMYQN